MQCKQEVWRIYLQPFVIVLIFCFDYLGMVRSSFDNPLALPGKSSRNMGETQSTPAVRQFSAPKAVNE